MSKVPLWQQRLVRWSMFASVVAWTLVCALAIGWDFHLGALAGLATFAFLGWGYVYKVETKMQQQTTEGGK